VGFRWYCRERAMSAGVTGSVRNLPDGRVEAVFEGESGAVDEMVRWCRSGPSMARVESLEVDQEEPRREEGFSIGR